MKAAIASSILALVLLVSGAAATNYDVAILNFALNLEYLEANFYSCAAYGVPLNGSTIGGGPVATGCRGRALLSPFVLSLAKAIAVDEINHVNVIRAVLGAAAVPQPRIDIGPAFALAANLAINATLVPPFTPYGDDIVFLHGAFIFEDVGVTAYKGAAALIFSDAYLTAAAGILAVEAYHAGAVRALLLKQAYEYVFPYAAQVKDIIGAIATLRDAVDGPTINDAGIIGTNGTFIIAPSDINSIVFSRTPAQVFPIVYLGNSSKGGFFPNGMNGALNKTM